MSETDAKSQISAILKDVLGASPAQIEETNSELASYQQIIHKANEKINLISHSDLEIIWERHYMDALIPIKLFPDLFKSVFVSHGTDQGVKAIDLGSGAGMPGLILKMALSSLAITFVESINKKCEFINSAISELSLSGATVKCDRGEVLVNKNNREQFDFSFSRAMAKPWTALEVCIPFVKVGGHSIFWGGGTDWESSDLSAIANHFGAEPLPVQEYTLPSDTRIRKIFAYKKTRLTDPKYPRRTAQLDKPIRLK